MSEQDQIFWGRVRLSSDDVLLELRHSGEFFDLSGSAVDQLLGNSFHNREVSVLGHMGTRPISPHDPFSPKLPSLIVTRLVFHEDIRFRAFEIYQAEGGTDFDNWLRAERELLALSRF